MNTILFSFYFLSINPFLGLENNSIVILFTCCAKIVYTYLSN